MRHSLEATSLLLEAWLSSADFAGGIEPSGFWAKAGPNGIECGRDLPASDLQAWCKAEFGRINLAIEEHIFQIAKSRMASRIEKPSPLAELFALAVHGSGARPPGQGSIDAIAGLSLSDIQALASELAAAERITIVLVGDVEEPAARDALEGNFAAWPKTSANGVPAAVPLPEDESVGAIEGLLEAQPEGSQKAEIQSNSKAEAFVAWRVPPSMGGERPSLDLFAEILAGSEDSVLYAHLAKELGCSTEASAFTETAGKDFPALFIVQADAADGHTLEEAQKAMVGAIQKAVRDGFGYIEINRAANRMDTKYDLRLSDAAGLAQALIDALGDTGDWRPALNKATSGAQLEPNSLTQLLRPMFAHGPNYEVLVRQDPIRSPRTPDHARLIALLMTLHAKRGSGYASHADREKGIGDSLIQFGQMPFGMRKQLLKVLESEAAR